MHTQSNIGPQVGVEQVAQHPEPTSGRWRVAWHMQNLGGQPLQLLAVRLPHSRFRSEERELTPPSELLPDERARILTSA